MQMNMNNGNVENMTLYPNGIMPDFMANLSPGQVPGIAAPYVGDNGNKIILTPMGSSQRLWAIPTPQFSSIISYTQAFGLWYMDNDLLILTTNNSQTTFFDFIYDNRGKFILRYNDNNTPKYLVVGDSVFVPGNTEGYTVKGSTDLSKAIVFTAIMPNR